MYASPEPVHAKEAVDLAKVREAITEVIESDMEKRADGTSLYGTFIRLSWHCSGTFNKQDGSGGSNGARMRFNPEASWGANAGLGGARAALEPVKAKFPEISYADLYTYSGVVAVEEAGGPTLKYRLGREDMESGETSPPDGRLPDADKGSRVKTVRHIRDIFYRMGFNDQEIVALSGAHALGRCHEQASGYTGPWTRTPTTFTNSYYILLRTLQWVPKVWDGPFQYVDACNGRLMMLPTDVALLEDGVFSEWVEIYANDSARFFEDFSTVFQKLTELGTADLIPAAWA